MTLTIGTNDVVIADSEIRFNQCRELLTKRVFFLPLKFFYKLTVQEKGHDSFLTDDFRCKIQANAEPAFKNYFSKRKKTKFEKLVFIVDKNSPLQVASQSDLLEIMQLEVKEIYFVECSSLNKNELLRAWATPISAETYFNKWVEGRLGLLEGFTNYNVSQLVKTLTEREHNVGRASSLFLLFLERVINFKALVGEFVDKNGDTVEAVLLEGKEFPDLKFSFDQVCKELTETDDYSTENSRENILFFNTHELIKELQRKGYSAENGMSLLSELYKAGCINKMNTFSQGITKEDFLCCREMLLAAHGIYPTMIDPLLAKEKLRIEKFTERYLESESAILPVPYPVPYVELSEDAQEVFKVILERVISVFTGEKKERLLSDGKHFWEPLTSLSGENSFALINFAEKDCSEKSTLETLLLYAGQRWHVGTPLIGIKLLKQFLKNEWLFVDDDKVCMTPLGNSIVSSLRMLKKDFPELNYLFDMEHCELWESNIRNLAVEDWRQLKFSQNEFYDKVFSKAKSLYTSEELQCPYCSAAITVASNSFHCENDCITLPRYVEDVPLTTELLSHLFSGKTSELFSGNTLADASYTFTLSFDKTSRKILLNPNMEEAIGICPCCQNGVLNTLRTGFKCSNSECNEFIKTCSGGPTPADIRELIVYGKTKHFVSSSGESFRLVVADHSIFKQKKISA